MTEEFEHIVIGGGAAGCVAAARLADDGKAKVLLLEAGYSNRHPLLDMPPGIFKMINGTKYMRYHKTAPQEHLGGRVHDIPQGHVLGGGSSVNAQVYMRGRPADYNGWQEELRGSNDAVDWSWESVLPHFRGMEGNNRLSNEFHGTSGPLLVSDPGHIDLLSRLFVQAVQGLGEPFNPDFNGAQQRGVGFYQFMNRQGKRSSSAYAYISSQEANPNLTVRLRSEVQKITLDGGRASGVVYKDKSGNTHNVHCSGEIIVSAGALVTPKLLMLSGIGPADHLTEVGIDCLHDRPGVGENLIDHPEVPITARVNGPYGYYKQGEGWRMIRNGLQFKLFGSGPVTSAGVEAGAFVNPGDPDGLPTIQAFCVPIVYVDRDTRHLVEDGYGLTVTTVVVKPRSRGSVSLASADPADMPVVSPNLLKEKEDMDEMVRGQRFFLDAFAQSPLAEKIERVMLPGPDGRSDGALRDYCRRFVKTNYHPAGTARMGKDGDPMAVLDPRMRVRGIAGLRVCDMSAMPDINAGNTQAPAMMLGDRCADMVLGRL
ncbi:GMC family oxidoreductase [Ruegeria sp. HKCCD8929]|uniref:GMC family oxidoreductase n=1 Tax=Ruegeria sp. HKCCD8929 TaxID=2683006 RepID=UPI0014890802|nr:GMC family oxidoreductase N-terminal domain-containing protein [Ruegeria sp. HKCCD8929]